MISGRSNTSSSLQFMETQTYSGTCLQVLTITFLLARRKLERCRELRGHWISHARMIKVYFRAERQSQSKVLLLVPNWTAWKGVGVGGITKLHNRQLYWHLKFNSEFDGCNTPKMRSDQGASNTPDKKQWPISFSFQISFFFLNQSPIWPLTSAHYWAVGHMVGTRYTLGPRSSHQNTAYGAKWCHWSKMAAGASTLSPELTCLTAHRSTRSTDPQATANTTGTISTFDTAYQLIGTGVVPSVGLILSHATLHVSH